MAGRDLSRPGPARAGRLGASHWSRELAYVLGRDRDDVDLVLVIRRYKGYAVSDDKIVFGVELRLRGERGYETHIVEIGSEAKAGRDADRWEACTRGAWPAASSPRFGKVPIPGGRAAPYRDAYTLFGPATTTTSPRAEPRNHRGGGGLQNTVDPDRSKRPSPTFSPTSACGFFHGARPDAARPRASSTAKAYGRKRGERSTRSTSGAATPTGSPCGATRCGCSGPRPADADHRSAPARYLDPVELVASALDAGRLPEERAVAAAHGDLHGRNVLLGVRRSPRSCEYPAVFDYGGMGESNVLPGTSPS